MSSTDLTCKLLCLVPFGAECLHKPTVASLQPIFLGPSNRDLKRREADPCVGFHPLSPGLNKRRVDGSSFSKENTGVIVFIRNDKLTAFMKTFVQSQRKSVIESVAAA